MIDISKNDTSVIKSNSQHQDEQNLSLICTLVDICAKNNCSIKYETDSYKIEIDATHKNINTPQAVQYHHASAPIDLSTQAQHIQTAQYPSHRTDEASNIFNDKQVHQNHSEKIVTSDLVGTLYLSPSPNADNFVKIGSKVSKGQQLCIIECMKVMNPIEAPCSGEIIHIHAGDAEIVEYGKPVFTIREAQA